MENFDDCELKSSERADEAVSSRERHRVLYKVYQSHGASAAFKCISHAIVLLTAVAFVAALVLLTIADIWAAVRYAVLSAIPFLVVTAARKIINAPRPYELIDFYERKPKGKAGQGFPSRHVFSIFLIGVSVLAWNVAVGCVLIALGVCLAVFRVLLGIHFIRDVVAGGAIGALSGAMILIIEKFIV